MPAKKSSTDPYVELAEKVDKSLQDLPKWVAGRTYLVTRDSRTGSIISRHEIETPKTVIPPKKK
jgi:hypothetical protein